MPTDIVLDPETFSDLHRSELEKLRAEFDEQRTQHERFAHALRHYLGTRSERVALPSEVIRSFGMLVSELAEGHAVRVSREDTELTTSEAAEVLNVSRPFLVRLLDEGEIPHRKVGTHRRVRRSDVLNYLERSYREAEEALQELVDMSQELGMGYE